jgi:transposase InsO family protein
MQTYGLSWAEAADRFLVSVNTIARWVREATAEPTRRSVGVLLKTAPPLRCYSDVVRDLVSQMDAWGFGGNRRIAQTLARAGVKIGRETIRRWRRAPRRPPDPRMRPRGPVAPVRARRPNDVWLIDLTTIRSLFGLRTFKVGVVLDAYARLPLAAGVFVREPTARQMARLVSRAARRVGPPRYLVSDRGSQFTARLFAQTLGRLGIRQRFGAVGSPGVTARIERFWRTLKLLMAVTRRPPLTRADLATRLEAALIYYAMFKPHAGLSGATPVEIYLGLTPAHTRARAPTRHADMPRLEIGSLDVDRRLPIVLARAA